MSKNDAYANRLSSKLKEHGLVKFLGALCHHMREGNVKIINGEAGELQITDTMWIKKRLSIYTANWGKFDNKSVDYAIFLKGL